MSSELLCSEFPVLGNLGCLHDERTEILDLLRPSPTATAAVGHACVYEFFTPADVLDTHQVLSQAHAFALVQIKALLEHGAPVFAIRIGSQSYPCGPEPLVKA
jgi:hypothetical protein